MFLRTKLRIGDAPRAASTSAPISEEREPRRARGRRRGKIWCCIHLFPVAFVASFAVSLRADSHQNLCGHTGFIDW